MYFRLSFIILFSSLSYAGSVQDNRNDRLNEHKVSEVKGIESKYVTKASNGNIYIQNARVYSGSKNNRTGQVSIDTGTETRKVILKNLKVSSKNSASTNQSTNSVLSIKTKENTTVVVKNSNIHASGVNLNSSSNDEKNCVGVLCVQSDDNSKVLISNTNVSARGSSMGLTTGSNAKKSCTGVLCVQADESSIDIRNSDVSSSGTNNFSTIKR